MHSQPFCPLRPLPASCTPLHSTPGCSKFLNATTMFMIKSYLWSLKPSHIGDTISRVLVCQLTSLLTTRTFSTFPPPKSSCVDKHIGQNFFPPSTSLYLSSPENWEPNLMLLLDDGMSILKRGIVTMPLSTAELLTCVYFWAVGIIPSSYFPCCPCLMRITNHGPERIHSDITQTSSISKYII